VIKIEMPGTPQCAPRQSAGPRHKVTIEYEPGKECAELKSLKMYLLAYRNLGIFYENAVNKMKDDLVKAMQPVWLKVTGEFTARGHPSTITTEYRREARR
jgi:7-cyano-7-deazaguanine reductase